MWQNMWSRKSLFSIKTLVKLLFCSTKLKLTVKGFISETTAKTMEFSTTLKIRFLERNKNTKSSTVCHKTLDFCFIYSKHSVKPHKTI